MSVREFKPERPLLLSHLPKALRDKPAIRALTLRVIENGSHYIVCGRTRNYLVCSFQGSFICDCPAASSGNDCSHKLAAINYHERKYNVKISPTRPIAGDGIDYKQPVRLQRGLYGGMFSRYTAPKQYAKFQSQETEEKFFVSFVVTHDAAGRQLPKFSEAFCGVRTKLFFSEESNMMSTLCAFYAALLHGKLTAAQIAEASDDELPDLDELIGYPAQLFIDPSTRADKNGIYVNKIDTARGGFDPAPIELKRAIAPLYKQKEVGHSEDGRAYLKKPAPEYEDPGVRSFEPSNNGDGYFESENYDRDIPF